jgi:hypothetical protein
MSGTLCWKHFEPVLKDGGFEPEIKAMWPLSPCVICGRQPGAYSTTDRFVLVTDETIERAIKLADEKDKWDYYYSHVCG